MLKEKEVGIGKARISAELCEIMYDKVVALA